MARNSDYIIRINKSLEFIDKNLDRGLSLEQVSQQAHYSPYHFHRIFTAIIGEPLHIYITRKRIEKAASLLLHNEDLSIIDIALKSGFNSNASFTRAFTKFYNISPSGFKNSSKNRFSKISKTISKNGQNKLLIEPYICNIMNHKKWIKMNANIEVKEMPSMQLAYITQIGPPETIGQAYNKLMHWAGPKGIMASPNFKAITIYHDSPKITEPSKVRMSACCTIDTTIETKGVISKKEFSPGKCIVSRMTITLDKFTKAWEGMFVWLNENGYEFDNEREPFEIYHNNFNEHPEKKCILDICIPVK